MPLYDYNVNRDLFEDEEDQLFCFPCCACKHQGKGHMDHPCRVCDHNINAQSEYLKEGSDDKS